jgi:hypothetical protein
MDTMQLLGRLFSFLSECSSEDLSRAANAASDAPDVANALRSLALYRRHLNTKAGTGDAAESVIQRKAMSEIRRVLESPRKAAAEFSMEAQDQLRELVLSDKYFGSKKELAQHLTRSGIKLGFTSKDARSRIADRVVADIKRRSPDERREVLKRVFSVLPEGEVARWFDLIRG